MKNGERGTENWELLGVPRRLSSPFSVPRSQFFIVSFAISLLATSSSRTASACPFCQAVQPTFSQRRESAAVAALAEAGKRDGQKQVFAIDQVFQGKDRSP